MRLYTRTAAIILVIPTWASAQETAQRAKPPLGEEAYRLLTSFYDYDRDIPLEARVVEKQDRPNCMREKIVFRARDSWVVAYLGVPKTGSPPFSCVLVLHGVGGEKSNWWEEGGFSGGAKLTNSLLDAGIAVFTPDAQYSGERLYANGFESAATMVFRKGWWSRFQNMFVQSVIDCRRAVDYLETRTDIDGARIGVLGYSLGGMETFALAALDARFKVAVACVPPLRHESTGRDDVWAPRNFARAIGDRPFLMQMGDPKADFAYTKQQVQRVYDLISGSKKQIVFYDSGHMLPDDYASKASEWLQEGLK